MATDTLDGLFGPSPEQVRQQMLSQQDQAALMTAKLSPFERAAYYTGRAGSGLVNAVAPMLGMVNPAQQQAAQNQQAMQGADLQTPEGLRAVAMRIKDFDPRRAMLLANKAVEMEQAQAEVAQKRALAEKQLAEADRIGKEDGLKNLPPEVQAMLKLQTMQPDTPEYKQLKEWLDKKMTGKGEWSEPFNLAGATVQRNAQTGEIRTAVARAPVTRVSVGGGAGGTSKPKNLGREAGLKWELDNGLIDQATYDAAISATPGGALRQKQNDAVSTTQSAFSNIERNVNQLYDPTTKKLKPAAQSLFGQYAQYRPEMAMSQESVDANLALEALRDQVMMANLADAKQRVGQSFGSMQVQEWDKFTQQLTSLKRGLGEKQAAQSMRDVLKFITDKREVLNKALNTENIIQADRSPTPAGMSPAEFNARWATLQKGQSLIGPDGKTYTKK